MIVQSQADLDRLQDKGRDQLRANATTILVGMASCGMAAGAGALYSALEESMAEKIASGRLIKTGCIGFCQREPLADVRLPDGSRALYGPLHPDGLPELIEAWAEGELPEHLRVATVSPFHQDPPGLEELIGNLPCHPFYEGQVRIAGRNCGQIDPENILHALALGAYQGLSKALHELSPEEVIEEVSQSGLRGRGGAGFPTGVKWRFSHRAEGPQKWVVCNADEGDPGAYMDRSLLEGDPHSVLEGMMIGAYAVGADRGVIYVRKEYPLAIERLRGAIADATRFGLLGKNLMGSDFSFEVELVEGAGAFVSGEETALIASIEGRAAEPRPRPPYPAVQGLYGCPTVINNVETWCNVPVIISLGSAWYRSYGTEKSKGTKVFSLVGAISNTGLVEVPLGTPLDTIVERIGGGARPWHRIKAVQTGGPSGGCIPADKLTLQVDYEVLQAQGSIMGSGGMVVLDDGSCMVDMARYFLRFTCSESCGKCTPCREGLDRMLDILKRIVSGRGTLHDLQRLEEMALAVKDASLCGLGKSAPNPVLTTLRDFRDEYLAHIVDKRCPAGVCRDLIHYRIDEKLCSGCHACARACPVTAISGEKNGVHSIREDVCVKCGACLERCPEYAVYVV